MIVIKIDPSVTPEQRADERFIKLLAEAQQAFNYRFHPMMRNLISLHEGAHSYFAKKAGAIDVVFLGPEILWDVRNDCPAISHSSCVWTTSADAPVLDTLKGYVAGYICRREMSSVPNDAVAIGADRDVARVYFNERVGGDDKAFQTAIKDAEDTVLIDLRSPAVRREVWAEAKRFREEVFLTPTPKR